MRTTAELAALILERLNEGEGCIRAEFVCSTAEGVDLRREFAEAENAVAELVRRASTPGDLSEVVSEKEPS